MELQYAVQSLPSCQRCQRLRKKCSAHLPACLLCEKAQVECTIYDHALKQVLSREYIHSLIQRLGKLKADKDAATRPVRFHGRHSRDRSSSRAETSLASPESTIGRRTSIDNHFIVPTMTGYTSRFQGSSSVFNLTVEVLALASKNSLYVPSAPLEFPIATCDTILAPAESEYEAGGAVTSMETLHSLLTIYMSSINTIYPFIDEAAIEADVEVYSMLRTYKEPQSEILRGKQTYQYFRVAMMCAISSVASSRRQPSVVEFGNRFYAQALRYVEEVTSEVSPQSLQSLLLLVVYCLFYPRKGNIWKLLDFACRLSVQLGYHTEQHPKTEGEKEKVLRRNTFWALYSIERLVGQFFGRPSDLPEPIITAEYPPTMPSIYTTSNDMAQSLSAAHVFRLMYLRSEIYTDLYLPASAPSHGIEWFVDRYSALRQWHREMESTKPSTGCGTTTCDVIFHSSIIFLFQRLTLEALSDTRKGNLKTSTLNIVPSESYWSACELIKIFENIMRKPESSELGLFPMTFLSAYSIWLAGMTILAHCLLSIDGRVETSTPLTEAESPRLPKKVDYTNLFELSSSCLVLLAWCADNWTGMGGMLDAYKQLSQRLLPIMVQRGLV